MQHMPVIPAREAETGGWQVQGQPGLHIKFKVSLGYISGAVIKVKLKQFINNNLLTPSHMARC